MGPLPQNQEIVCLARPASWAIYIFEESIFSVSEILNRFHHHTTNPVYVTMFESIVGLGSRTAPVRFSACRCVRSTTLTCSKTPTRPSKETPALFWHWRVDCKLAWPQDSGAQRKRYDEYSFGSSAKDPREVAKAINITGPSSGRSVRMWSLTMWRCYRKRLFHSQGQ